MASNYDEIDLDWTWDGDLKLDTDGDLKDTSRDVLQSLQTEIHTIVKSELGDWREDISVGANLDDFIGEPNTRETGVQIKARIENALNEIINLNDLSVRITPVGIYRVLISISVEVAPTPENRLQSGISISTTFLYDYMEKGVYIDIEDFAHFQGRSI